MCRLFCVLACLILVLPLRADDDKFVSENQAKSVRPAKPREERRPSKRSGDDKKKDDSKKDGTKREVLSADDVKKIAAEKGKDRAVRGKVHEVFVNSSASVVNLNFGPDFKTCFKAVVFQRNFDKWEGGVDALKKLQGKTVVVEGVISEYRNTPQIVLNVPSQLKVEK
jgi:hypothetical protein